MLSEWNQNCPTNISENLYWYTLDSGGLDVCFGVILKSSEKYWIVRLGVTFTSVQQPTVGALGCSGRGPRLPGWIAEDEKLLRGLLPLIITIQFNSCRYSLHAESGSSMQSKNFGQDRWWPRLPLHKLEYLLPANHPRQGWQRATSNTSWWCNRWRGGGCWNFVGLVFFFWARQIFFLINIVSSYQVILCHILLFNILIFM